MKKKVLIIASWYPSDSEPLSGIFVQEQAAALTAAYDVAVLVPGMAAWRAAWRATPKPTQERQAGLTVYREFALPLIPHGPEAITYQTFARAVKRGYKRLLAAWGRPDIIHAHVALPGGWAAVQLGQSVALPVVLTEHASPFAMHLGTDYTRRLVRETLLRADCLIAVSPAHADQMLAFQAGLEINVLGNLVRTDFFTPLANGQQAGASAGGPPRKMRFLAAGRLAEQKGLGYLLAAAQRLVARGVTAFELAIGGDGPDRGKLEQMARELGITECCRFLGALERMQLRHWMQQCDVFVLPSLHESFGIVLGEAMACGKPVIATRCGGPQFLVTDETGILVDVGDADALAQAMTTYIERRVKYDPKAVRAAVVRRFGEAAYLRHISALYDQVWRDFKIRDRA